MHLYYDLQTFPHPEDLFWLLALLVVLECIRLSAERAVYSEMALGVMLEALAAAETAAAVAALPAHKALAPGAGWLAAMAWVLAWLALAEWRARRWRLGETGNPAALVASVAAGEWVPGAAPLLLWAQLTGAWLGYWYMQWISMPRPEPNFCPPLLQGPLWVAALLECCGALAEELLRRGARPSAACFLQLSAPAVAGLRAAMNVPTAAAAAHRTGALFNPALGIAALHACSRRPRVPLLDLFFVYAVAPCAGALLGLLAAPMMRCAVQKVLHASKPEDVRHMYYWYCMHPA